MSKSASRFLFLLLLLAGAIFFSDRLQSPLLSVLQSVNTAWTDMTEAIRHRYEEHFDQQATLRKLRGELELYRQSHLVSHAMATEFNALLKENNASYVFRPEVSLVRAESYAAFGDMNKLWLTMEDFNRSRIYGLIYNEQAAGIITQRNGKPLALLNGDYQCTYAVFVGDNKAPGIVRGRNSDTMLVQYIPTWLVVSVGDEVVTSGLDRLFFSGIKVGKVLSVEIDGSYQNALIEPYYKGNDPDYFHAVTRVR